MRAVERLLLSIYPEMEKYRDLARPLIMLYFGMINWTDNWYSEKGRLAPAELATLAAELFLNGVSRTEYTAIRAQLAPTPEGPRMSD